MFALPAWLTGKLISFVAVPLALALGAALIWVSISDGFTIRSLKSELAGLNDAIHGGEPGYAVKKPGYLVQIASLRGVVDAYKRNEGVYLENQRVLRGTIADQNHEIDKWKLEGLRRKDNADKAIRDLAAERSAGAALAAQILAMRSTGNPAVDANGYILRAIQ